MSAPPMRSPAPRENAENRAEVTRNGTCYSTHSNKPEGDIAALFVAGRYRVAVPVARAIVMLASLGRAFA
jgi:hypothetical protein